MIVTPEYQRVRGEVARLLLKTERKVEWGHCGTVDDESWRRVERRYLLLADQILSIKGLAILADDQTLPDALYNGYDEGNLRYTEEAVKQDMLKANFKKVV